MIKINRFLQIVVFVLCFISIGFAKNSFEEVRAARFPSGTVAVIEKNGEEFCFDTLEEAVSAASTSDLIQIQEDIQLVSSLYIDKEIIIDLNGYEITNIGNFPVLQVYGNVIIEDSSSNKNGKIVGNSESKHSVITCNDKGRLTIRSGIIESQNWHTITAYSGGNSSIYIEGGTFITFRGKHTFVIGEGQNLVINGGAFLEKLSINSNLKNFISSNFCYKVNGKSIKLAVGQREIVGDVTVGDHVYDNLVSNDSGHWHECDCGKKGNDLEGHTHSQGWQKDSQYHWYECEECGRVINKKGHDYVENIIKVATEEEDGLVEKTCNCGHKIIEIIPKITEKGLSKWVVVTIAVCSVLLLGLVSFGFHWLVFNRRKAENIK